MNTLFDRLLSRSDPTIVALNSIPQWFAEHRRLTANLDSSIERAVLGGFTFRQTGFAFASAYQSAMESMFELGQDNIAALCHTEKGIKKPRDMNTALFDVEGETRLVGQKSFVSCGSDAKILLISALDMRGGVDRRDATVRIIKLKATQQGVATQTLPTLPFVPELSHAALTLNSVHIDEDNILGTDGYIEFIKPFRSEEDLHILAALAGQRLRIALELKQQDISVRLLSLIASIISASEMDRNTQSCHLLLAGLKSSFEHLVQEQEPTLANKMPEFHQAWQRDRALLSIAEKAQAIRTANAWTHFFEEGFFAAD